MVVVKVSRLRSEPGLADTNKEKKRARGFHEAEGPCWLSSCSRSTASSWWVGFKEPLLLFLLGRGKANVSFVCVYDGSKLGPHFFLLFSLLLLFRSLFFSLERGEGGFLFPFLTGLMDKWTKEKGKRKYWTGNNWNRYTDSKRDRSLPEKKEEINKQWEEKRRKNKE